MLWKGETPQAGHPVVPCEYGTLHPELEYGFYGQQPQDLIA